MVDAVFDSRLHPMPARKPPPRHRPPIGVFKELPADNESKPYRAVLLHCAPTIPRPPLTTCSHHHNTIPVAPIGQRYSRGSPFAAQSSDGPGSRPNCLCRKLPCAGLRKSERNQWVNLGSFVYAEYI